MAKINRNLMTLLIAVVMIFSLITSSAYAFSDYDLENASDITMNESVDLSDLTASNCKVYKFTPEKTGKYRFESKWEYNDGVDEPNPYCHVFKGKEGSEYDFIAHDDDSGEGNMFCVSFAAEQGCVYYLVIESYDSDAYGDYTATLSMSNIKSISFTPANKYAVEEYINGSFDYTYEGEEFFYYYFNTGFVSGDVLSVTTIDDKTVNYTYDADENAFINGDVSIPESKVEMINGQYSQPWTLGSNNYLTVKYMDESASVPVTVEKSTITGISYEPAKSYVYEENNIKYGYMTTDDDNIQYFVYNVPSADDGDKFTVKRGEDEKEYVFSEDEDAFIAKDGSLIYGSQIRIYADQAESHFTVGKNNFQVQYGKAVCNVPVTVEKNTLESMTFTPVSAFSFVEGDPDVAEYWADDDDNNPIFIYSQPQFRENDTFTLVRNETATDYLYDPDKNAFISKDDPDDVILEDDLVSDIYEQYNNPWKAGEDNAFTIQYSNQTCRIPVKIVKNTVEAIKFTPVSPLKIRENDEDNGFWNEDQELHEYETYFEYAPTFRDGDILTVTEAGEDTDYTYESENDLFRSKKDNDKTIDVRSVDVDTDQSPFGTRWEAGNSYTYNIRYMGKTCVASVSVVHDAEAVEEKEPTCTEAGNIACWKCKACGRYFSDEDCEKEIDEESIAVPAAHKYGKLIEKEDPECEENGMAAHYECSGCHKYFVKDNDEYVEKKESELLIPAKGHNYTPVEKEEPGCEKNGKEAHYECTACHRLFVKDGDEYVEKNESELVIPAAHVPEKHSKEEPGCETKGTEEYWECTTCHKLFSDESCKNQITEPVKIDALGHDYEEIEATGIEAKCESDGKTPDKKCTRCEKTVEGVVIEKLGHDLGKHEKIKPSCGSKGIEEYWECTACHKLFSDKNGEHEIKEPVKIDALEHDYLELKDSALEPTCEHDGHKADRKCANCGDVIPGEHIAKLQHQLVKTEKKAATADAKGNKEYWTCKVCGRYFSDASGKTEIKKDSWVIPAVSKKSNPMTVTARKITVNAKDLAKGAKKYQRKSVFNISKAEGTVSFSVTRKDKKAGKKIKLSSKGTLTLKKGLKRGEYIIKVKVKASGTKAYKSKGKTVKVKVIVK